MRKNWNEIWHVVWDESALASALTYKTSH